ncbi:hypothetical protein [Corynebacterium casei]|uniref:hypothetical protein n=1 Tax=Corynebacterium casei TaxID=160386 RepID=UPI000ECEAA88|nr:hypothetical protein [Corynebacterium casei]MDN5707204.1 hypothetical protein [Corynebacterium casei]MDN5730000.1 hypothetical protein [Corynebacterium casei]MDN5740962.1 hypothetical protein [Corynebacterium casei]MDN5783676.1 hypothetical protein [Corynebacterium casei]MDN5827185.1 hypothetical protein [Corynebacterium casei]
MKITRLAVAAAAVSLTLVGTGVAQADTTKEHTTTEATATAEASSEESSSQSSSLSSTDENVDSDKDGDKDDAKEQDEFEQLSSQAIEDNAGPFAPLLLAIMPTLGGFFGIIDQLVGFLSLIAGPALNAQYSAK